jgi:poly [ADP-ribose] polymerase
LKQFEAKFKDKSGLKWDQRNDPPKAKKYTFIERDYNVSSSDEENEAELPGAGSRRGSKQSNASTKSVESTLQKPVQRLMEMIFNKQYFEQTLTELHYDAQKLPLGKLSKRTLNNGFSVLKNLAELIRDPTAASGVPYPTAIENLTNQYYTTIPHVFGRHRPPLINNEAMIKKEIEVLEALTDMEIANEIMKDTKVVDEDGNAMHQLDRHYAGLGMKEMTPCTCFSHPNHHYSYLTNPSQ